MDDTIAFQCMFQIRGGHGSARKCGRTFAQFNEYVDHYQKSHVITRMDRRPMRVLPGHYPRLFESSKAGQGDETS